MADSSRIVLARGPIIALICVFASLVGSRIAGGAETVVIDQDLRIPEGDASYDGKDLVIDGAIVAIDGSHRLSSLQLVNRGTLIHTPNSATETHRIDLEITGPVLVEVFSAIDVSGAGYLPGLTKGNTADGGAPPGSGGSHGGAGQLRSSSSVYGDYCDPNEWGSGGGAGDAPGGGQVRLKAASLVLDGLLSANGAGSNGAGAGGGIFLDIGVISGVGQIQADAPSPNQPHWKIGGGGRIAIYAHDWSGFNLRSISAWGFGGGTVYLKDKDEPLGTLRINRSGGGYTSYTGPGQPGEKKVVIRDAVELENGAVFGPLDDPTIEIEFQGPVNVEVGRLETPGDFTFGPAATLWVGSHGTARVEGTLRLDGELILLSGSPGSEKSGTIEAPGRVISSRPLIIGSATRKGGDLFGARIEAPEITLMNYGEIDALASPGPLMHRLDIDVAGEIRVDSTSHIAVSGAGYLSGRTSGNTSTGGAGRFSGGSHGGKGFGPLTNRTYGDPLDPEDWGAGGGHDAIGGPGAPGGGLLRLSAAKLTLDGFLSADGSSVTHGGDGAGGSILVEVDELAGSGLIRALGGEAGGGGGRIAIYALDKGPFDESRLKVEGGSAAEAGTANLFSFKRRSHIRSHQPEGLNGGYVAGPLDHVDLHFNKPLDLAQARLEAFELEGPSGRIFPTSFSEVGDRLYRLEFPLQSENGAYHFAVLPTLIDIEGYPLDNNGDGEPGEARDDIHRFVLFIDTVAPQVTRQYPDEDITGTVDYLDLWFSEAMDDTSLTVSAVTLTGPGDLPVGVTDVHESGLNRFSIEFPALSAVGVYTLRLSSSARDLAGNPLGMDYTAEFTTVQVDFEFSDVVVQPQALVAGDPVTVTWKGRNASGARLLGAWTDAVYLSKDPHWDAGDLLLSRVRQAGGLEEGKTYLPSVPSYVPGLLPGSYYVLVRADVFNDKREIGGEGNNVVAAGPYSLDVRKLTTDGGRIGGKTGPDNRSQYFAVQVRPGDSLKLILDSLGAGGKYEVYISFESMPTRLRYDSSSSGDGLTQELTLTGTSTGGTYYILIYETGGAEQSFELSATTQQIYLTGVSPRRQQGAGIATLTLSGAGFDPSMTFSLISRGVGRQLRVGGLNVVSPEAAVGSVDLASAEPGMYDILAVRGQRSDTLPAAFEVLQVKPPNPKHKPQDDFQVRIVPPSALRDIERATGWVEYRNIGDAPMAAPLMVVEAKEALLVADGDEALRLQTYFRKWPPTGVGSSVQLIATGSGATPGILQPGDSGRVPFYYIGLLSPRSRSRVDFAVGALTEFDRTHEVFPPRAEGPVVIARPGDGDGSGGPSIVNLPKVEPLTIDWVKLRDESRPDGVPADAWAVVVGNIQREVGFFWADYVKVLARNSTYLFSVGQPANDIQALFAYQAAKASASLTPVRDLASEVDASSPAPGLPLVFRRTYAQPIISRYRLGTLGRGWSHNWEIRLDRYELTAVVRGPAGADRYFRIESDGTFTASRGDFGQLVRSGETFILRETDQTVWQFAESGRLERVEDSNANSIRLTYGDDGRLSTLAHSNGDQIQVGYNADGRIETVLDRTGFGAGDGLVTRYEYTGEHLTRVVSPGDRATSYRYNTSGVPARLHALTSITHPDGRRESFEFDDWGRLTRLDRGDGAETVSFSYGVDGQVLVSDGAGSQVTLFFGPRGQLAQARDALGGLIRLGYDKNTLLTQLIGPGGERFRYGSDSQGNLTEIVDALRLPTTFAYEPKFQSLASFTDPKGHGMDYGYDPKGNLASITYEDGSKEGFTSDTRGNVATSRNRRGQTLVYTYNAGGQVTSKDDPTTPEIDFEYTYDVFGNLTSAKGPGGTIRMQYDPVTQVLVQIEYPGGQSFAFSYDRMGRRVRRQDQSGDVLSYAYDAAGRLDRLTAGAGALIADYDYDGSGRLLKKSLGNGVYTTYEYDPAGRLIHLVNFKPDNTVLSRFDYAYNESGQRTSMGTLEGMFLYDYDPLGQLVRVQFPDGKVTRYVYDGAGNRVEVIDDSGTTSYTTNELNQYTKVGDVKYTYDADGNMTGKLEGGALATYAYDIENRLVGVTTPTESWMYEYDALGQRVAVNRDGAVRRQVVDPIGLGNVAAEYDGDGQLVARYDHGIGLLGRRPSSGAAAFYTFDAIGNTRELTGAAGAVLNSYAYETFGALMGKREIVKTSFEFVGEWGVEHDDDGLHHMRRRSYSNPEGRFIQPDSIISIAPSCPYAYAINNPIMKADPVGRQAIQVPVFGFDDFMQDLSNMLQEDINKCLEKSEDINCIPEPGKDSDDSKDLYSAVPRILNRKELEEVYWRYQCQSGKVWCFVGDPPPPSSPSIPSRISSFLHSFIPRPYDPNDKLGPQGSGPANSIPSDQVLPYIVHFENVATAAAPAALVEVTDVLDEDLDFSTLEIKEIAFAGANIQVPAGLNHYEERVPFESLDVSHTRLLVDISASLDLSTGTLTLTLMAIDPATGWIPEDPQVGFLYPNDETHRGEGHLAYTVRHLPGLPSGTTIDNSAKIVFDFNEPIDTPTVRNTIDAAPPESHVLPLPARVDSGEFRIDWSGADDPGGSGIASYDVYVSIDNGPFVELLTETPSTFATLTAQSGHSFAFYSLARDVAGHVEAAPTDPDTRILVLDAVHSGFFLRGDADSNGSIQITDAILTLGYLFIGGRTPHCLDAADFDDDGMLNITDAIASLGYQFQGSKPPAPPGPDNCGVDETQEEPDLRCAKGCP